MKIELRSVDLKNSKGLPSYPMLVSVLYISRHNN